MRLQRFLAKRNLNLPQRKLPRRIGMYSNGTRCSRLEGYYYVDNRPSVHQGTPPTTLAEFTLGNSKLGGDFYDVSLADGFNLPMQITNNKKCPVASCPVDLNSSCPTQLRGATAKDGSNTSCKSSCLANLDGKQGGTLVSM